MDDYERGKLADALKEEHYKPDDHIINEVSNEVLKYFLIRESKETFSSFYKMENVLLLKQLRLGNLLRKL